MKMSTLAKNADSKEKNTHKTANTTMSVPNNINWPKKYKLGLMKEDCNNNQRHVCDED